MKEMGELSLPRVVAEHGTPAHLAAWIASQLPAIPPLWKNGPLAVSVTAAKPDEEGNLAWRSVPWRVLPFLPGQAVDIALLDAHTLLVRSPQGEYGRLETRDGLRLVCHGIPSRPALSVALTEAVRVRGGVALHACGYVSPGASSLTAVLGRSGAGKSTHLLRQLAEGAKAVSEDTLWIDATSGECTSVDAHVRLLPDNIHAPTEWGVEQEAPAGNLKRLWQVPWSRWEGGALARLGELCYLEMYRRRPLAALPPVQQVRYLWEALGQPVLPAARRIHEAWVADVVRRHLKGSLSP